jgi:hypothetical protein
MAGSPPPPPQPRGRPAAECKSALLGIKKKIDLGQQENSFTVLYCNRKSK